MQHQPRSILNQQPNSQGSTKESHLQALPQIPDKLYFTIGDASFLCSVKPHVLRYWEQEFPQLSPIKRRGNRRYYQRSEIILIRRIKNLLYDQGFTIEGARSKLDGDNIDISDVVDIATPSLIKDVIAQLTEVLAELERK